MHSTTLINHQPHAQQGLWYSGQVVEERRKKQRAVLFVVVLSVAAFVRRLFKLVFGLLRLSYRKVCTVLCVAVGRKRGVVRSE